VPEVYDRLSPAPRTFLSNPDLGCVFESWGIYRLKDGKVVEHFGINDALLLMMQLGGLPGQG
jgi:hypothetical protein